MQTYRKQRPSYRKPCQTYRMYRRGNKKVSLHKKQRKKPKSLGILVHSPTSAPTIDLLKEVG